MKMKRNLIILAVVLVLAVGLVIGAPYLKPAVEPTPTATVEVEYLTQYAAVDVKQVQLHNATGDLTLEYDADADTVSLQGDTAALDQTSSINVLSNLATVSVERVIDENPTDLEQFGLKTPQATATVTFKDGATATYLLGKAAGTSSTYYLMKEGDKRVLTVWTSVATAMTSTRDSLLAKTTIGLTQTDIRTVTVRKNGQDYYSFTDQDELGDVGTFAWIITSPWKRSADVDKLAEITEGIAGMAVNEVVNGNPTQADLATYGLDSPQAEVIAVGENKTVDLFIGGEEGSLYYYVKFTDDNKVYTMAKTSLAFIDSDPYTLTDDMILLVNIAKVSGLKVDCLGVSGEIDIKQVPVLDSKGNPKQNSNGTDIYTQEFTMDGKVLDEDIGRTYYRAPIAITTHSYIEDGWKPTGAAVGTITFTRTSNPKTVTLKVYAYDQDFYAVTLDDEDYFRVTTDRIQTVADDLTKLKNGTLEAVD